jgi:hypothetical protein
MNPVALYMSSLAPLQIWTALARKTGDIMLASAQVVGHRTGRILSTGIPPSASDRREFALMGWEKIATASESTQSMALSWITLNQQLGAVAFKQLLMGMTAFMSMAASHSHAQSVAAQTKLVRDTLTHSTVATSRLSRSAGRTAHRNIDPIYVRTTANAKRLAKRK